MARIDSYNPIGTRIHPISMNNNRATPFENNDHGDHYVDVQDQTHAISHYRGKEKEAPQQPPVKKRDTSACKRQCGHAYSECFKSRCGPFKSQTQECIDAANASCGPAYDQCVENCER